MGEKTRQDTDKAIAEIQADGERRLLEAQQKEEQAIAHATESFNVAQQESHRMKDEARKDADVRLSGLGGVELKLGSSQASSVRIEGHKAPAADGAVVQQATVQQAAPPAPGPPPPMYHA